VKHAARLLNARVSVRGYLFVDKCGDIGAALHQGDDNVFQRAFHLIGVEVRSIIY